MNEPTLEEYQDISSRMAQELQDFVDEAQRAGSDLPGVRELLKEYDTLHQRTWHSMLNDAPGIDGDSYVLTDIGTRMLTPRELYRAQGFDDAYKINIKIDNKPLSKAAQVRMCGNSVSPVVATALVQANFKHEATYKAYNHG